MSCLPLALASCSGGGGDDGGDGGGGVVNLETLSGRVAAPGGISLPGVTVEFEGQSALTDSNGVFLIPMIGQLPAGPRLVAFDGSTATLPGTFPALEVAIELGAGDTDASLPQLVTLPDLDSLDAGVQSLTVDIDGAVTEAIDLENLAGTIALDGPLGTTISLDGQPAVLGVDFNVTPVPPTEVPMPLPEGLVGSSFVTIQPGNGVFETPAGGGLGVTLPNDLNLELGTEVEIWSFDRDVGTWVNRSEETGNLGTVVDSGLGQTVVRAEGVITEGGWHSPVVPLDPACATTVTGNVCDPMGNPLPGLLVTTSLGQFTQTDDNGDFEIPSVPAANLGVSDCPPIGFSVTAMAQPLFGLINSEAVMVLADDVVQGGTTDAGKIELTLSSTGCVTGIVQGMLEDPGAGITIDGPTPMTLFPGPSGTFQGCGLEAGSYTASVLFSGAPEVATVEFEIFPNQITSITLQGVAGGGTGDLTVNVMVSSATGGDPQPVSGALVFIVGSDPSSTGGLQAISNGAGQAIFNDVDGPFQVTAISETSLEVPFGPDLPFREGATAIDLDPTDGQVNLTLFANFGDFGTPPDGLPEPGPMGTVSGTLQGNTENCPAVVTVQTFDDAFSQTESGLTDSYSFDIPAGAEFNIFVTLECGDGNSVTTDAGIFTGLAALSEGESRVMDIDLNGPNFAAFDVTWPLVVNNAQGNEADDINAELSLFTPGALFAQVAEVLDLDSGPAPQSLDLPDFTSGLLSGFMGGLSYASRGQDLVSGETLTQSTVRVLDTDLPSSIELNLASTPRLAFPVLPLTTAAPGELMLGFNAAAAAPLGLNGFEQITFLSDFDDVQVGPDGLPMIGTSVIWSVYLERGTTEFDLPPIAEVILEPGSYSLALGAFQADVPFEYADAFASDGSGAPPLEIAGIEGMTEFGNSQLLVNEQVTVTAP